MYHHLKVLHVPNGIGFKNDHVDQRIYCFTDVAALYLLENLHFSIFTGICIADLFRQTC